MTNTLKEALLDRVEGRGFNRAEVDKILSKGGVFIQPDATHTVSGSLYTAYVSKSPTKCIVQLFVDLNVKCQSSCVKHGIFCPSAGAAAIALFLQRTGRTL